MHFASVALCCTVEVLLFCWRGSIASHKTRYSCRLEARSTFTLLILHQYFGSGLLSPAAYFALYLPLLEQPLLSELLRGGILITRISHASLQQSLSLSRGSFSDVRTKGCQNNPCYRVTGAFTSHRFRKDASMVSEPRNRQQRGKTEPCPQAAVFAMFPYSCCSRLCARTDWSHHTCPLHIYLKIKNWCCEARGGLDCTSDFI